MKKKELTKLFNEFVGSRILNPTRMTCDFDMVMGDMQALARQNGKYISLVWGNDTDKTVDEDRVKVFVEKNSIGGGLIKKVALG